MDIRPHGGKQEQFLASSADIAIFGGAAGGGKTWAMLLEAMRHVPSNPRFAAVYFRRNTTQIRNPGGLWDQAMRLYPYLGGVPTNWNLEWRWRGGGRVKMAHLEHENTKLDWHGAEIPLILFDELPTFTASQFWYLLSRNRSMSGVRGYIRATCNPDADSWVAELIAWWIDQDTGLPIEARCGIVRWFVRRDDVLVWGDSEQEMLDRFSGSMPKSMTFIGAVLADNPTLEAADPGYRANLMAMQLVERERLLGGNWKIRPAAGLYFKKAWVRVVDVPPAGLTLKRGWDLAATEKTATNDPDWTAGVQIGRTYDGHYIVMDATWLQGSPQAVSKLIVNTASHDGKKCEVWLPQDPGAGGKAWVQSLVRDLAGTTARYAPERGVKTQRFSPFSAQCEAGNVTILRGDWNKRYMDELEAFPEAKHDDIADATSTCFNALATFHVTIGTGFVGVGSREQAGWSPTD